MAVGEVHVVSDIAAMAKEAADHIVEAASQAVARQGRFNLVLSGGSTPRALYRHLATLPAGLIPWKDVHIYFGDERCVPPNHADSNYRLARETFLTRVGHSDTQVNRMLGELPPIRAATQYDRMLRREFPGNAGPDLTLLGMGDDGHTASLFPHTAALKVADSDCVANEVTQRDIWRITMTAAFLNRSRLILVMVAGASKAARLREVLEGPSDPDRLPIQRIDPRPGRLIWLVDQAAAGDLAAPTVSE